MPKSRNKHSRQRLRRERSRRRNPRSSRWFVVTVTVACLLGVVGVVLAAGIGGEASASPPQPPSSDNPAGDHWHAAFAVNICGEWLSNPSEFETAADNPNVRV